MRAVALPEATHRGFGRARAFVPVPSPPISTTARSAVGGCDAALHETADRAVLHRDVAGRAREVVLAQPRAFALRRVIGKAEVGPVQRGLLDALGQDLPHRQRVLDLLQHEIREHGQDLQVTAVAELVGVVEQARVLQRKASFSERRPIAGSRRRSARGVDEGKARRDCRRSGRRPCRRVCDSRLMRNVVKNVCSRLA